MNKRTFGLALIFFCASLTWLVVNIFWAIHGLNRTMDLVIAAFFFLAGIGMLWNEFTKKKRKHIADVNKHQIP